ncbi:hypothetical protein [Streptomyces sp. AC495_CC817]|uniref:hypothetical protein n=1 Tax=Streptomyces sp. AC495_CC817 TaxID=2823900 RepID=UPI001C2542E5|nr:hypothetical protein [Streptomyces sp. AC495_CC817]
MAQPQIAPVEKKNMSLLIRGSIWIAIGALIAAALVCVVWVLVGDQDGLIGRAFLTILLLAAFAGIAILEAGLAPNRPDWLALASMVSWIVALLVGAFKIWLPEDGMFFNGAERFFQLLLVVGILQLALLHVRLYTPAAKRHVTTFTRIIYIVTVAFLVALVGMVVFYLTFTHNFDFGELYWRIVVALTILVAVGTTLIPLLNALFAPKKPTTAPASIAQAWPTYADGMTPLPALADGSPDWNAYYTGYPTQPQAQYGQLPAAPQQTPVPQAPVAQLPEVPVAQEPPAPAPAASPAVPPIPPAPPAPPTGDAPAFPPAPPLPPR